MPGCCIIWPRYRHRCGRCYAALVAGAAYRRKQGAHAFPGGFTLVQHRVDLVQQRHAHATGLGGTVKASGIQHALGDHAGAGDDLIQRSPLSQHDPDTVIAAVNRVAGAYEIPHTTQAIKRLHLTTFGHA